MGRLRNLPFTGGESRIVFPSRNIVRVSKGGAMRALQCPNDIQISAVTARVVSKVVHGDRDRRFHGAGARSHLCYLPAGAAAGGFTAGRHRTSLAPTVLGGVALSGRACWPPGDQSRV